MRASEMTNEELANWLAIISGNGDFRLPARYRDYLREAAARLRKAVNLTPEMATEMCRRESAEKIESEVER